MKPFFALLLLLAPIAADAAPKAKLTLVPVAKQRNGRAIYDELDGAWTIHYSLAFSRIVESPELTLKISDPARKQILATRSKFAFGERSALRGSIRLSREEVVSPNAALLLEIESDGRVIASRRFFIQGKAEVVAPATGTVEFSAADAVAAEPALDTATVRNAKRERHGATR